MENISIQTTQNVLIKHNIASVGERMLAAFLDYFIMFIYLLGMSFIFYKLVSYPDNQTLMIVFSIPVMFYSFISEIIFHGQSIGKKILKIKVVKADGSQASIGNFFVRWIFRLVDILLLYGSVAIVTVIINGKGQRLGDIAAKTTVVSLKDRANLQKTIYVDLPADYELFFPEVKYLTESDIKTIFDVLGHYSKNISSPQAGSLVRGTVTAIESKIGVLNNTNPVQFLRKIIYDYNSIHKINSRAHFLLEIDKDDINLIEID